MAGKSKIFPLCGGEELLQARRKGVGNRILRAICAAATAVPALIGIEDYRLVGFVIHMDYIPGADLITDAAPGALIVVYDG